MSLYARYVALFNHRAASPALRQLLCHGTVAVVGLELSALESSVMHPQQLLPASLSQVGRGGE